MHVSWLDVSVQATPNLKNKKVPEEIRHFLRL
jgi:hypothetical protein